MLGHLQDVFILVAAWLAYFVIHSWMASLSLKYHVANNWPGFMPVYRICFNLLALLLIIPPLLLTFTLPGPVIWQWNGLAWWVANGFAVLALAGVFWSLRDYDGNEFLGIRQWRERETAVEDQEGFHISTLHRFVRHPWYSLSLVLIWTRDMNLPFITTAILMTLYFIVGSQLEERKLLAYHGAKYRRYRELVPALFPVPWKYLTRRQADDLLDE